MNKISKFYRETSCWYLPVLWPWATVLRGCRFPLAPESWVCTLLYPPGGYMVVDNAEATNWTSHDFMCRSSFLIGELSPVFPLGSKSGRIFWSVYIGAHIFPLSLVPTECGMCCECRGVGNSLEHFYWKFTSQRGFWAFSVSWFTTEGLGNSWLQILKNEDPAQRKQEDSMW